MNPVKLKTIEVVLTDGQKILVHGPRTADLGTFLRSMPALKKISGAFQTMEQAEQGIQGIPFDLQDSDLEGFFPLLAVMSDISVAEFKSLPLMPDGMEILKAFSLFTPKNAPAVQTEEQASSPTGPTNTLPGESSGETTASS